MAPTAIRIPRPPGAVLFDMDGVLVDSFDAWVAVVNECRERRGLSPLGPAAVRAVWGQGLTADCDNLFPGADPAELAREYEEGFSRRIALVRVMDGAEEVVAALGRAAIPLALVTNSPAGLARRVLDQIRMTSCFPVLAAGDEVRSGKPAPDLVLLALTRLGARNHESVLVGDTQLDVEAARRAGVPVVGYGTPGDARVGNLRELVPLFGLPPV